MCGRYSLIAKQEELVRRFLLKHLSKDLGEGLTPRFNIAPSQPVMAIRRSTTTGERIAAQFRWGLVPFWAKDPKIGYRMINARSETAAVKRAFRAAMKRRSCIIPASGFYEWKRLPGEKRKQPYYIYHSEGEILAMAGLWERWSSEDGAMLDSCTILTTRANEVLQPVHDRMPVFLHGSDFESWLNATEADTTSLSKLFEPYPADALRRHPVSTLVNSPKNDGPELLSEIDPETGFFRDSEFGEDF